MNDGYKIVSWTETRRKGKYVMMTRGTGETGWWYDCSSDDFGNNPMDYDRELRSYTCRTCGKTVSWAELNN
jgi:hypothetical protein